MTRIVRWIEARHAKKTKAVSQLAFYYARKSGVFGNAKPCGEWFHLLHNWTIGNGPAAGNVFAIKALETWNRRWNGQHEQMKRVYSMAYNRYLKG